MNEELLPYKTAIVFSCDEAYVPGLLVALHSLGSLTKTIRKFDIFVYEKDFSERSVGAIDRLKSLFFGETLKIVRYSEWKSCVPVGNLRFPSPTFLVTELHHRVELEDYERVVWMDADILILQDITPILTHGLNGKILGAVYDNYVKEEETRKAGIDRFNYYSSGVVIFDLKMMQEENPDVKGILEKHPYLKYPDQDALNIAIPGDSIEGLPLGYNMFGDLHVRRMPYSRHLQSAARKENVIVLHIVGLPLKPWNMAPQHWAHVYGAVGEERAYFFNYKCWDDYARRVLPFLLKQW